VAGTVKPTHMKTFTSNCAVAAADTQKHRHLASLSRLMFNGYSGGFDTPVDDLQPIPSELEYISALNESELAEFIRVANLHHVTVRALRVIQKVAADLEKESLRQWSQSVLDVERQRIAHAVEMLAPICAALEGAGCSVTVIKSLDHWPDLGSDLDLYTTGDANSVNRVMCGEFGAQLEPRSWGDRLAGKWNFSVPGLPELIEIHVQYLGQTGEHKMMARRVVERSVTKEINGHKFRVPAPEERVVISTLQRMYRHFYFRLCDMTDFSSLLESGAVNFAELRRAAEAGGIWPGVATFLLLIKEYAAEFGGSIDIPGHVVSSACSQTIRVHPGGDFLRVPMLPTAGLYGSQLLNASRHRDLRAMCRLPLLPPLALSALLAYRITGSDKGVW
jgi:hypothetical protein